MGLGVMKFVAAALLLSRPASVNSVQLTPTPAPLSAPGQVYVVNRDRSSRAMPASSTPPGSVTRTVQIATTNSVTPSVTANYRQETTANSVYPSRRDWDKTTEVGTTAQQGPGRRDYYTPRPPQETVKLPGGAAAAAAGLTKPTKYHYYPHNQHIYLLPECAIQQVCNAVYVRLNFTQPLCACPSRYREPCSASINTDDLHTTELVTDPRGKALTLVKTCEPVAEMRECRAPRDWSLLALQNIRTGKSHYLVICRCPPRNILEGPMSHDQPTYASVPGIRVYGMMCTQYNTRRGRHMRYSRSSTHSAPPFPWKKVKETASRINWDD
ncbi:uncharacterized protein dsx-c73A [Periplaneta americana]|uniref:uncharacterized protein dsx-c73A n=1 Tax=Periplaneta americana TaxID=6978 RepID=UPI0037E74667